MPPSHTLLHSTSHIDRTLSLSAGLIALGLHLGLAAWLIYTPTPSKAADTQPPMAISIELADIPEALNTLDNEIAEQQQDSEASIDSTPAPPTPEKNEIPAPQEDPKKPNDESDATVEVEKTDNPAQAAAHTPPLEHNLEAETDTDADATPSSEAASTAALETRKAQVSVRQSNKTAAQHSASGVSAAQDARWQARLMAHLEKRKRYPSQARRRGLQGVAYVQFLIDENGHVQHAVLVRSSGHSSLDDEALHLVRRASPVPHPPPGAQKSITAPIQFSVQ